jgi:hypothetical protein
LLDVWSADGVEVCDFDDLEDLAELLVLVYQQSCRSTYVDGPETSTMSGGHILVQRLNSISSCHFPVLLVHVVGAGARVVSNPDTEVLDLERALLVDLVERNDFTVGLLDFSELHQKVPESRLGDHIVGSENSHAVEFGSWVGVSRQVTADDLVFLEATCCTIVSSRSKKSCLRSRIRYSSDIFRFQESTVAVR